MFANLDFRSRGKIGLFGGFLIHTVLGSQYIWANLCEYVTAYFVQQQNQDITTKEVNIIFPIILLSFPLGILYGTTLANKYGSKKIAIICSCVMSTSIIISSFAIRFWVFAFFYAMVTGLAMGFIYMIPLENAQKFFPDRKGTVYGVIICGYGFGSLVFNWILFFLINPNNIKAQWNEQHQELLYPPEVSGNLPITLVSLAFIYLAISIIGSLLIITPSSRDQLEIQASLASLQSLKQLTFTSRQVVNQQNEFSNPTPNERKEEIPPVDFEGTVEVQQRTREKKEQAFAASPASENGNKLKEMTVITWQDVPMSAKEQYQLDKKIEREMMTTGNHGEEDECSSLAEAVKQKELYASMALASIGVCYGLIIASNYKNYGLSFHNNDKYYYYISTASSIANGLSRVFWGFFMDKIKLQNLIVINLSVQIVLNLTLPHVATNQLLYSLYIILSFFFYGGWYVIMPAHCYKLFGSKVASRVYSVMCLGFPIAGLLQQLIVKHFSWDNVFLIVFAIQALGLFIVNIFPLNINWREKGYLKRLKLKEKEKDIQNIEQQLQQQQQNQQDQLQQNIQFNLPQASSTQSSSVPTTSANNKSNIQFKQSPNNIQQVIKKNDYYMMDYEL